MNAFYLLIFLLLVQSLLSLRGGRAYLAYVRGELARPLSNFTPFVTIFAPCRGLDQGLRDNLAALFRQDYPAYEIVFVTDHAEDAATAIINQLRQEFTHIPSQLLVAGSVVDGGQKVHNLRYAVPYAAAESEVFAFVDSDARPRADWLRYLVAPLSDENVGAATGYRWFVPLRGGWATHLRAVWNASIASALGGNRRRNFCWGGATAIRRATFTRLDMLEKWRGMVSDDFMLTRTLQAAGLPIHFVPQCLTASYEDCTARELWEFTTRQIKITRVYAPNLWQIVLFSNLLFGLVFFGGSLWGLARALSHQPYATVVLPLLLLYGLGSLKAWWRWRAVRLVLGPGRGGWAQLCLWPLTALLFAANGLAAAGSQRIVWRGISYDLQPPPKIVDKP